MLDTPYFHGVAEMPRNDAWVQYPPIYCNRCKTLVDHDTASWGFCSTCFDVVYSAEAADGLEPLNGQ
ncbi:hypothetical protein PBI_NEBKISS_133 [Mycobacterium phage Nebkiss]|nr:hypothetical protein PBI_NEBKISS_133 [Mycobacterium phage Nebkiss]